MNIVKAVKEYVFEGDRPFASCHASTVLKLENGDILTSYFAGSKEGNPDVSIWCSKRKGGVWQSPVKVAFQEGLVHWNPVLFLGNTGEILLFYKVGKPISEWYTMVMVSNDSGETWSEPVELVKGDRGGRGPVKNKPIRLADGSVIAPASLEGQFWDVFVDISKDNCKTWEMRDIVKITHPKGYEEDQVDVNKNYCFGKGIIQPTLWESEPGNVHMLTRSTGSYIYRSDSTDCGRTWCGAYATDLPNNSSGIDLVKAEHAIFLVYNKVKAYKGARSPLNLAISIDNGNTWRDIMILENKPGEYSYPAIIYKDNALHITYTWKRERIAYWKIDIE